MLTTTWISTTTRLFHSLCTWILTTTWISNHQVTYAAGGDSLWCGGCVFNESALAAARLSPGLFGGTADATDTVSCALDGTAFNGVKYDGGIPSNQPFVDAPAPLGTFTASLISPGE
jgi:hypothetical protein